MRSLSPLTSVSCSAITDDFLGRCFAEGAEGENDERPDQLDEMGDAKEEGAEDEGEDPLAPNQDPAQQEGDEEQPQQDQALDQSLGGADQGETGGEGEQDAAASKPDPATAPDTSRPSGAQSAPQEATEPNAQREAGDDEGDEEMQEDTDTPAPTAPSAAGSGPSKQRAAADPSADPSAPPQDQKDRSAAEPQRSLGDSLQNWRRRLEAIGDLAQPEEQEQSETAPEPKQDGAVEYVQDGDEQETDEQALGPANEEQVQKLEQLHLGEETAPADDFPAEDDMAVDDADDVAQQQQQPTTMQLKGSSLTEADAKAIPAAELRQDRTFADEDRDMEDEVRADDNELGHPSSTFAPALDLEQDQAVEQALLQWRSGDDPNLSAEGVWRLYESLTRDLSYALTEQLRLILEPTLATRLKGDYRSGKRLNMKKIIPYIASEFTKDKIWLRRTRPSQREYQVLIAIDDSKSMADSHSVHLAFQSLALISRALTRLEVGGVSISRFGEATEVLHPFEAGVVSDEAGASLISKFTFQQKSTDVRLLVERTLAQLAEAKDSARSGKSSLAAGDLWQLVVIISDGICQDHDKLRALLRRASEQKVMFVFGESRLPHLSACPRHLLTLHSCLDARSRHRQSAPPRVRRPQHGRVCARRRPAVDPGHEERLVRLQRRRAPRAQARQVPGLVQRDVRALCHPARCQRAPGRPELDLAPVLRVGACLLFAPLLCVPWLTSSLLYRCRRTGRRGGMASRRPLEASWRRNGSRASL